ncbi:Protein of unknown function [Cotesia congregata]|uniref:Uncharacterized protein n=1 Tax=Cotesia congregata TaxID=51543 RepID=A0A8J2H8Y4_COTCN|nr:Protein of unknown function [Cotesia congregata]
MFRFEPHLVYELNLESFLSMLKTFTRRNIYFQSLKTFLIPENNSSKPVRLQVDKNSSGYVFTRTGLTEESVKTVITSSNCFIGGHLTVRLDSMFKAVQFPAGITDLYSGLSNLVLKQSIPENVRIIKSSKSIT